MAKKTIFRAAFLVCSFIMMWSTVFSAPIEILNLQLNETAKPADDDKVWKEFKFALKDSFNVKFTVSAAAKVSGKIVDDFRLVIDDEDFGWGTWDGRELKGKSKSFSIERNLKEGDHKVFVYAMGNPVFGSIKIEADKPKRLGIPTIKESNYIDKVGIKLIWNDVSGAKTYIVYKSASNVDDGAYQKIATLSTNAYFDPSVSEGEDYKYKVIAIDEQGERGEYSDEVVISIKDRIPPGTPKGLALEDKEGKVGIKWNRNNDEDLMGYNIYRKSDTQKDYKKIAIIQKNEYDDLKVEQGRFYTYKVTAIDYNSNESMASQEANIQTKGPKYIPEGIVDIDLKEFMAGDKVTIYFSAKKSSEMRKYRQKQIKKDPKVPAVAEKVYIKYGFNNWDPKYTIQEGKEPEMKYDADMEYFIYTLEIPVYAKEIDLAFMDEFQNWDKNYAKDYVYYVKKDTTPPEEPVSVKATPKNSMVYLEWQPSPSTDTAYYQLHRSITEASGYAMVIDNIKNTFVRDDKAKSGVKYFYKVLAVDYTGNKGKLSNGVAATPLSKGVIINNTCVWEPEEPSIGNNVRIYYSASKGELADNKAVKIKLGVNNWDSSRKTVETKAMVYDKILDAWYYDYDIDDGVNVVNVAFTDGAKWDTNLGANWNVNVKPDTTPPEGVKNFTASSGSRRITLEWKANEERDIYGYNIFRGTKKINTAVIKSNKYNDENLEEGKEYSYRIVALDIARNESASVTITASTLRDIIIVPEGFVFEGSVSGNRPLRLMASIDSVMKWQIDIMDEKDQLIKTTTGRSDNILYPWTMTDEDGKKVKPGNYKYRVSIIGAKDIIIKEVPILLTE